MNFEKTNMVKSAMLKDMVSALDACDVMQESCVEREILHRVMDVLTNKQKAQLLRQASELREHFARTSSPGHQVWYSRHLQTESKMHDLFFPPADSPGSDGASGKNATG